MMNWKNNMAVYMLLWLAWMTLWVVLLESRPF